MSNYRIIYSQTLEHSDRSNLTKTIKDKLIQLGTYTKSMDNPKFFPNHDGPGSYKSLVSCLNREDYDNLSSELGLAIFMEEVAISNYYKDMTRHDKDAADIYLNTLKELQDYVHRLAYKNELSHAAKGEEVSGHKYISRKWNGKSWDYIYTTAKRETKAAVDKLTKNYRVKQSQKKSEKENEGKSYYDGSKYDYEGAFNELMDMVKKSDFAKRYPDLAQDSIDGYKEDFEKIKNGEYANDSWRAIQNIALSISDDSRYNKGNNAARAMKIFNECYKVMDDEIANQIHYGDPTASRMFSGQSKQYKKKTE